MSKYKIELLKSSDIYAIVELEANVYGAHHWSKDSFLVELNNHISSYRCAVNEEKKCIGYMGIWKILNEAHITTLSVHPEYQNKKIAHKLLLASIDECYKEKIKFITLEVRVSNVKAIHLYEKFGFKSMGVRKKYYQDNNEDALIMWSNNIFDKDYKELYAKIKSELG